MTSTQHTPGPWITYGYDITTPEGLFPIAKLNPNTDDINELESNARLIAAAPELLEALKGLLALYQKNQRETLPEEIAAEYAIAKARGA